jgi:acetyltransferase
MFDGHTGNNLVGWPGVYQGSLAVVSQSGNVALSMLAQSYHNRHAGFTTYIGVGNEADMQFHEYLDYFGADERTRAVIMYAEGFKDGRAFFDVARRVARQKPVVLYKAGRTAEGEGAALSHSGSLAGDYAVSQGVLKQAGIVLVERSDEMFAVADTVSRFAGRPGRRVVVLSEGGGPISQAADALAERGLSLPKLAAETVGRLKVHTPNATQLDNPVDAGGGTDPHPRYMPLCTREILADPSVDALLIVGYFGAYQIRFGAGITEIENQAAREIVALSAETGKPVVVQCHYADSHTEAIDILRAGNVIVVRSIEIAAACLAAVDRFHQVSTATPSEARPVVSPQMAATALIDGARSAGRGSLLEPEALDLLTHHGIEVPPHCVLSAPEDALALPAELAERPVALKIVSKDILHKSDVGGVMLSVSGRPAILEAANTLLASVSDRCPDADLTGILISPMAAKGVEIILGVTHDRQFGPVMMFGLGGIFVEVLKDVTFRALPISAEDAGALIDDIRAQAMLQGTRGGLAIDREALVALMLALSDMALAHPQIAEIDLNPVIVNHAGCTIVDARIVLTAGA